MAPIESAIAYASRGWRVLALWWTNDSTKCACGKSECKPGKHPLAFAVPKGCLDATTNIETIQSWWKRWPCANVGIATGRESGLVALDIDPVHAGDISLSHLEQKYGKLPETACVTTRSGGQHFYFAHPGNKRVANVSGLGGNSGIDIRGDGGYVVAPPSIIFDKPYFWDLHFDEYSIAPLPDWILDLQKKDPVDEIDQVTMLIPAGRRSMALTKRAGAIARQPGATPDLVYQWAKGYYEKYCAHDPPMTEDEFQSIKKSSVKWIRGYDAAPDLRSKEMKSQEAVREFMISSPDPTLRDEICATIIGLGYQQRERPPILQRRQDASNILLRWLIERGGFVRSEVDEPYYFYRDSRCLFKLTTERWHSWLHALTGLFPLSDDFRSLNSACITAATQGTKRPIVRVSFWNVATSVLYVSRFDGSVYRLDGGDIAIEPNGESVLFDDEYYWTPYEPDYSDAGSALESTVSRIPNWDEKKSPRNIASSALLAWIVSTFFPEICPTRPFFVIVGDKGSGKSMTFRCILRSLFGPIAEVSGVPDKPDGFTTLISSSHLVCIDNLDRFEGWMQDKLARVSTGAFDTLRKLYTTNEAQTVRYRCFLCFTARTPDTLRRDDIADRLIVTYAKRVESIEAEFEFLSDVDMKRNKWWGDILSLLNRIVASIRTTKLPPGAKIRMADWERLGRRVSDVCGTSMQWDTVIANVASSQSTFILDDDIIVEAITQWMKAGARPVPIVSRKLYEELTSLMFGKEKPPRDWPTSVRSFGRRLGNIRNDLRTRFAVEWYTNRDGVIEYTFGYLPSTKPEEELF